MKTTIDLPDDLLIEAKKRAAETRTTIRALVERGLRRELGGSGLRSPKRKPRIRWVVVDGGGPPGLDISNREQMMDWLLNDRA